MLATIETKLNQSKPAVFLFVHYFSHSPTGHLGAFVERFWQINNMPPHFKERIVPSGTLELVINLHEDEFRIYGPARLENCRRFSGTMVSGTYTGSFIIDAHQHASVIGIHFRPGGAFPFLGSAVGELADTHVDLETLWGSAAGELRERLCAAREPAERFCLLEQMLMAQLLHPLEHHYAVLFALSAFSRVGSDSSVRDVAKNVGLSHRRFIQVFTREVGLTPKLFCRLRRFQQAFTSLRQSRLPDWSRLVVECGYSDQSHFIRDFRNFSGLRPREFLCQRSSSVMENHVPLAA
jgi:AraC-like DNA-binding protein